MFKALKTYLIKRKIVAYKSKKKSFDKAKKRVLIIFNTEEVDANQLKLAFQTEFFEGKTYTIQLVGFSEALKVEETIEASTETTQIFCPKYFDWKGDIKEQSLQSLLIPSYKYCFNFFIPQMSYLQLISAMSHSEFNIGISQDEINRFSIEVPEDQPATFFKEVTKYISKINYE